MKDGEVVLKKSKIKRIILFKNKFKTSLSNFMKERNLLIAVATSIGFAGVMIWLGNAWISDG